MEVTLNTKGHAEYFGRRTQRQCALKSFACRRSAHRTTFCHDSRRHLSRQPLHISRRSRHALWPLPEAAAMRIVAGRAS